MRWTKAAFPFLLALAALPAIAATSCPGHFLEGRPPELANPKLEARTRELCRSGFAALHSGVTRTPLWSAERLTGEAVQAARTFGRSAAFHAERSLPKGERAELRDYQGSAFDRGHLAPSEDMADEESQREGFSLANVAPQDPRLNRGLWAEIEAAVRGLALEDGEVYVVTGAVFAGASARALNGRVLVPTDLYKAVYDPARAAGGAYLAPNDAGGRWEAVSLARLREVAGVDAFPGLPEEAKARAAGLPAPAREREVPASGWARLLRDLSALTPALRRR